jgi:hypothetical protein
MKIASVENYYFDRLWNQICHEEDEAAAAEAMGMTVAELRKHNEQQAAEAAIERHERRNDE